ncbi:hypothetical protein JX265_006862 [Neoarthrinium moseri]|uniref:Uncharacterized protein n=1 Tax=Neoarthrinium moseri TaxID=1658444 RepID=A0A9Q0AP54_9PEZI|nr:hypothetical protein JX266_011521 [Neoarthrinium moseri]KAI1868883.1 hypothetical protein JX265_006862 [Neoarthrinium moseri]
MLQARDLNGNKTLCPVNSQFSPMFDPPGLSQYQQCGIAISTNTSDILEECCGSPVGTWREGPYDDCWAYCNLTTLDLGTPEGLEASQKLGDCFKDRLAKNEKAWNITYDIWTGIVCRGPSHKNSTTGAEGTGSGPRASLIFCVAIAATAIFVL